MMFTRLLNELEVAEFNQRYNTAYTTIRIKRVGNRYLVVADCDIKFQTREKEVINYFI